MVVHFQKRSSTSSKMVVHFQPKVVHFTTRSSTLPKMVVHFQQKVVHFTTWSSTLPQGRPLYHKVVHFKVVHFAFLGSSTFTPNQTGYVHY